MRLLFVICVVLAFAAPAGASTPSNTKLQREITALQAQNKTLRSQVNSLITIVQKQQQLEVAQNDRITCFYAVGQDDINSVWHTLNVVAQYLGFTPQPDYPRYDDGGACQRLGVTRIR